MKRLRYLWRAFHYRRRVNRREIALLAERVRAGDTVVDVGCHKGGFLYWMRRFVGSGGRVYGFEPQPGLARYMQEIVALQGWTNVVIEPTAVSEADGRLTLHVPGAAGAASPGATLEPAPAEPHHAIEVPVVALDSYFERAGRPRIAFIKCDVEGHELAVFRGAGRLLRRDRPVLLFECEQRHLATGSPADVFAYLAGLGYRGFCLHATGLLPVEAFRPEVHQPVRPGRYWDAKDYYNNFVFLPEDS